MSSQPEQNSPLGRVLKVTNHLDGTSRVVLDNGVVDTMTIVCHTEGLTDLLAVDPRLLRAHLMTRAPGHFRKKQKGGDAT